MKFAFIAATALVATGSAAKLEDQPEDTMLAEVEEENLDAPALAEVDLEEAEFAMNTAGLDEVLHQLTPQMAAQMADGVQFSQEDIHEMSWGIVLGQMSAEEEQPAYLTLAQMVSWKDMQNPDFELSQEQLQTLADKHFNGDKKLAQAFFWGRIKRAFKKVTRRVRHVARRVVHHVKRAAKTVYKYAKKCYHSTICSTAVMIGVGAAASMVPGGGVAVMALKGAKFAKYGMKAYKMAKYGSKVFRYAKKGYKLMKYTRRGAKYIRYARRLYRSSKYIRRGVRVARRVHRLYKKGVKIYRRAKKMFCKGHAYYVKAKKIYKAGRYIYVNVIKNARGQEVAEAKPNQTVAQAEKMAASFCRKPKAKPTKRGGRRSFIRRAVSYYRRGRSIYNRYFKSRRTRYRTVCRYVRSRYYNRRYRRWLYRRRRVCRRVRRLAEMDDKELAQTFSDPSQFSEAFKAEVFAEMEADQTPEDDVNPLEQLVELENELKNFNEENNDKASKKLAEEGDAEESDDDLAEESEGEESD